jgi:hypothetical protein
MIVTYITHTKFENLKIQIIFQNLKISKKLLPHVNGCNVHDI